MARLWWTCERSGLCSKTWQASRLAKPDPVQNRMNEPRLNLPELTVSELSTALKRTIEDAYGYVRVRGELGKVSYHTNGHVYFDLKDERACIAGVIWRIARRRASSSSSKPASKW